MQEKKIISGVHWDVDGVLIDSEPLHREKLEVLAREMANVQIAPTDWQDLHGKGDHYVFRWLKAKNPASGMSEEEFIGACQKYFKKYSQYLEPRPGAKEAFKRFAHNRIPQAIVTNSTSEQLEKSLKIINLRIAPQGQEHLALSKGNMLIHTVNADDGLPRKPAPDMYVRSIDLMNAFIDRHNRVGAFYFRPENHVSVEDSATGVTAALSASMLAVHWRLAEHDPVHEDAAIKIWTPDGLLQTVRTMTI